MATLRRWRTSLIARTLLYFMAASLAWLQVGPAYGLNVSARRMAAQQEAWRLAHLPHVALPPGLTQTPDAALQKKIDAKKAVSAKPAIDVRSLTAQEMGRARGRGPLRNPYFAGAPMPWQRAFHDVNICTGNLFKSFTDVQVAPARGAGLVLQRTYNSNEARVGPFGVGWTHAYDIRVQEAADVETQSGNNSVDSNTDDVPRTDFFGHKHTYHRDADGLYSPPAYLYDEMNSDYDKALVNGPPQVLDDTEKGMDGTVKHYISVVTNADGAVGNERACDYIQDRHGNTTTLTYGLSYVQPDGSTRKLLTKVTDPSGRSLVFRWTNLGTTSQPAYRITQVDAPIDSTTGQPVYRVVYAYYTDPTSPNAANDLYNLKSVTLDPNGLNRITTYTYTGISGSNGTDNGLLTSITDPLGHTVSYTYTLQYNATFMTGDGATGFNGPTKTGTAWVYQISEPGGVDTNNAQRSLVWTVVCGNSGGYIFSPTGMSINYGIDQWNRVVVWDNDKDNGDSNYLGYEGSFYWTQYDNNNNVLSATRETAGRSYVSISEYSGDYFTYGPHGNPLSHWGGEGSSFSYTKPPLLTAPSGTPVETTAYYNASKYFAKQSSTDMNGHTTAMDYFDSQDAAPGNRGEVQWVRDAGYSDPSSPSYGTQFTYTYNQYGQKTSETNLRGIVTQYTYGDQWGNLTQVVQDPGGTGHLNRTTTMIYDIMGRVVQSTDPASQISTFNYNSLGQPKSVSTPAKGSTPAETITYLYDGNGRTRSVQDNRGTTVMAYEPQSDRVQSVTDPITGKISYTYTLTGERLTMTLPGGGTWNYHYLDPLYETYLIPKADDLNSATLCLDSITDDQGRKINFLFNGLGTFASKQNNQVYDQSGSLVSQGNVSILYDSKPSNRVRNWVSYLRTSWSASYSDDRGVFKIINQNDYTYDNVGDRLTNVRSTQPTNADGSGQTDSRGNPALTSRTETYAYDSLNRLSAVDYGDGEKQGDPTNPVAHPGYTFDPMGNRLTRSDSLTTGGTTTTTMTASTFDAANRLLTVAQNGGSASAVTSDADGNTLTDTSGRTMTWDSQNRMASCTKGGVTSTYTYGADGLRRSCTVSGVTTYYAYDGQTMIREMKKNAQTGALFNTATYLQGPRGGEYRRDDTQVELDSQGRQVSKCRWYVYDGLGSVVGEVDALGNLTSSPKYDVYGAVRGNPGTASTRQGFVGGLGHVSDSETGLIYMRARYYDPQLGRFSSEDPSKNGVNWFAYCDNNPVNRVDRDGKISESELASLINWFGGALLTYATALILTGCAGVSAGMAVIRYGETVSALGDITSAISPQAGASLMLYGAGIQLGGAGSAIGSAMGIASGVSLFFVALYCIIDSDDVSSADLNYYSSLVS